MFSPSITDYVDALNNPSGVFRTLGEVGAERDPYGDVALRAGNSAAVFTYLRGGERRFLKCYVRPNPRLREIYRYIETYRPRLLPEVRLLADELYVYTLSGGTGWSDVVEGRWTEGDTLDTAVSRAARASDRDRLGRLADAFDGLCRELLREEWAHGDLKPENIVVGVNGEPTLIDCDAMWTPRFEGGRAAETGTPGYRHPDRGPEHFDKRIDDYPMLLVSATLRALSLDPSLHAKYSNAEGILFSPREMVEGSSEAFAEVSEMFSRLGMARELRMLEACCSTSPGIDDVQDYFIPQPVLRDVTRQATGYCSFVRRGRWGFADPAGNVVIAPFWDEVLDFRDGVAAGRLGSRWHVMEPGGGIVRNGLAPSEIGPCLRACRK